MASSFSQYGERLCQAIEVMRKVVYAFYDERFSFSDLIRAHGHLRGSLTDCLIGNLVEEDYKEFAGGHERICRNTHIPGPWPSPPESSGRVMKMRSSCT